MHFCLTCSSERPEFLPFSALIQAFIFGSCDDVAFEAELLLTLSFGVCGEEELDGVMVEFAGGVDCAKAFAVAPSANKATRAVVRYIIGNSRWFRIRSVD